jgi:hypothetical protein
LKDFCLEFVQEFGLITRVELKLKKSNCNKVEPRSPFITRFFSNIEQVGLTRAIVFITIKCTAPYWPTREDFIKQSISLSHLFL